MTYLLRPVLWAIMIASGHSQATATQATAASTAPVVAVAAPSPTVQSGPQPLNSSVTATVNGYPVTYGAEDLGPAPATDGTQCSPANAAVFVWCSNYDGTWAPTGYGVGNEVQQ